MVLACSSNISQDGCSSPRSLTGSGNVAMVIVAEDSQALSSECNLQGTMQLKSINSL
jgi:hypothetical protein